MASPDTGLSRIVLEAVAANKQTALARILQERFGLSGSMAAKIVKAAPIVLLNQLAPEEARLLCTALTAIAQQGGALKVEGMGVRKLPVIGWPTPPRIDGEGIPDILERLRGKEGVRVTCPCCGAQLSLSISVAASCAEAGGDSGSAPGNSATPSPTPPSSEPAPSSQPVPADAPAKGGMHKDDPVRKDPPPKKADSSKPAPSPADIAASKKKVEEDADALFDGITPLSPFTADQMVGSLENFETGLINLYEMEEHADEDGEENGK